MRQVLLLAIVGALLALIAVQSGLATSLLYRYYPAASLRASTAEGVTSSPRYRKALADGCVPQDSNRFVRCPFWVVP
jgi:hypothetical protein